LVPARTDIFNDGNSFLSTEKETKMKKCLTFCICLFHIFQLYSQGQWTHTQLSTFCVRAGAASLGSKVYVGGGARLNSLNPSAIVDIYDFNTQNWATDKLSVARELPAGVSCGSKVIFAGGIDFTNLNPFTMVDIYDTITKKWSISQLSQPRFSIAAVSYGDQVLFAGGVNLKTSATSSVVDIYNTETGIWTITSLSEARGAMGFAVTGSKAVFAGGFNLSSVTAKVDIYDFKTGNWTTKSLSLARGFLTATAVGNKIIIAGGMTADNQPTDRVDIYDVETDTWTTSALSSPRAFLDNATTACGKAFFAGGGKINLSNQQWEIVSDVVDIYDPETDKWSVEKLRNPITNHNVIANSNHFLVIGGTNLTDTYSYVDIYTCLTTGLEDVPVNTGFLTLFPNPASESVEISFSKIEEKVCVTILGISGQKVFETNFQSIQNIKLDLKNLKSGIYIIKTESPDFCITQKLILAKK
jgi:N-acetylneuraminic acid mutarotase